MKSNTATNKATLNGEQKIQSYARHIESELIRLNYNLVDVDNQCHNIKLMIWILFAAVIILMILLRE